VRRVPPRFLENRKYYVITCPQQGSFFSPVIVERQASTTCGATRCSFQATVADPPGHRSALGACWHSVRTGSCISAQATPDRRKTRRHGQDLNLLPGSILRVDVDRREGGSEYASPSRTPIVPALPGSSGNLGVRIPHAWRFSFDTVTGDLWIGDVGQNLFEKVTIARSARITAGMSTKAS